VKKILVIVLAVILTLSLSLSSVAFAAGDKNEVVPVQMILDASVSNVSTTFGTPKANLEVARSRAFSFGADNFLLSSIVDKQTKQAYMVSTDAQGKVWIAEPKIEGELIDHMLQMKPDETVTVSIWAIYVSPEAELWQIPSKYPAVPFEGYRPAVGANVSPEVLAAIEADMTEINLRANEEAVQPVVDFLQSTGGTILYVSRIAPSVSAELSKEDVYKLARLPEVKRISLPPEEPELFMDTAAKTINADYVWDEGYDGGGTDGTFGESKYYPYWYQTKVAVVDSGIDFSHPALAHAYGGDNGREPSYFHGTAVAGCIASNHETYKGIAYGTELLDANDAAGWQNACDWAHSEYADIYNMSFGEDTNRKWNNDYCEYSDHIASQWHRLVVCAAGNVGTGTLMWPFPIYSDIVCSPANAFNVIAVGGIDDNNTEDWNDDEFWYEDWEGSCWVNPNDGREKPEVCAPAVDIVTTKWTNDGGGFLIGSGTSLAAPQVAGIAAQLIEQDQSLVSWPELTKAIIMATAIHNVVPNDLGEDAGYPMDDKEGVGTVDAYAAYQCVKEGDYTLQWRPNDDPFYIAEFHADAGETVRFVINWLAHTTYEGRETYGLYSDFDLFIKDLNGNTYASSASRQNPWEIAQFTAPSEGTYAAYVTVERFDSDHEWVAAAWCRCSYPVPPVMEDFEWGSNDVSLATSGGDVTWSVQASGNSKAVITTTQHIHGTKGGKLYCDGTNAVIARYQQSPAPTDRGFYIRKDDYAYFSTSNAYNWRRVAVSIDTNEMLQYYDGSLHNVWQLEADTWYLIELKNMNYSAGTFDIYIYNANGSLLKSKTGATMHFTWGPNPYVSYSCAATSGGHDSVYLDDIY
jgi:hypothetical protein